MSRGSAALLSRRCSCAGTCSKCASQGHAPSGVHDTLRSPGSALTAADRSFFEPRFGHDFGKVRVHADGPAGVSALAVGAAAYTVGNHVVFAPGRYSPGTTAGRALLAHELSHVMQQGDVMPGATLPIGEPDSGVEREADRSAAAALSGAAAAPRERAAPAVMRTLIVDNPTGKIPKPDKTGVDQTNAAAFEGYFTSLSPEGNATVDATSGEVTMGDDFCPHGFFGRIWRGIKKGGALGARYGAYAAGIGALPGLLLGGLIGGIAGLFGADTEAAQKSSTPTGSTCLCDLVNSSKDWHLRFDDVGSPKTGDDAVFVPSPNSPRSYGAATVSGATEDIPAWLVLGHELCGHAWLADKKISEGDDPKEYLRHNRTVERENLIRAEHGLEARGSRLKDPYCGEAYYTEKGGPKMWEPKLDEAARKRNIEGFQRSGGLTPEMEKEINKTYLEECQERREAVFPEEAKKYTVDQRIP